MNKIKVGDGATEYIGSDRYPATVIAVSKSGKTVTIQRDEGYMVKGNFMQGDYEVGFKANPNGRVVQLRQYKESEDAPGLWYVVGHKHDTMIGLGRRSYYLDPSF